MKKLEIIMDSLKNGNVDKLNCNHLFIGTAYSYEFITTGISFEKNHKIVAAPIWKVELGDMCESLFYTTNKEKILEVQPWYIWDRLRFITSTIDFILEFEGSRTVAEIKQM